MNYTKLFGSIIHSTVWREANHVRLVWITMLAIKDRDGMVEASVPGLADAARVTLQECEEALERLSSPDPYSRSKDFEGRRIAETDGGWVILNADKYREREGEEDRKEKAAARQARKRERDMSRQSVTERDSHAPSRSVTLCHAESQEVTPVTPSDADADADAQQFKSDDPVCKVAAEDLTGRSPQQPPPAQPPPPAAQSVDIDRGTHIPCPPAAELMTLETRAALEVALIPGWAIDALVAEFAARYAADQSERRTLTRWRKGCAQAVSGNWNNPNRRPRKPEPGGVPVSRGGGRRHNSTPEEIQAYIDRTHGRGAA